MGCVSSSTRNSFEARSVWQRFEPVRLLGYGASSQVYVAIDKQVENGQTMRAVKLISKSKLVQHGRVMFDVECDILRKVQHPNIVSLLDAFDTKEDFVIVMPFLTGGQLFTIMEQLVQYSELEAAQLCKQMLQAVFCCHKNGIVHRDIKPANFCFSQRGQNGVGTVLKLIDFGLAIQLGDDEVHQDNCGTEYYMAPELLDSNFSQPRTGKILKASDMWALGILFFMLLTGTPPFDGYDEEDLLEHIKQGKYSWPKGIQVSVQAKGLVDRMLCVDPLKRITASDALMHPWLTSPPSYAPLNAVIQRLTNFSAATLVKKAIAGLLSAAPSDDSEQLFSLFQLLDLDGDKRLDIDELGKYLLNHGFDAEDAPIIAKQMLARFAQKKGMTFMEFENAHSKGLLGPQLVAIRTAFGVFDYEHRGFIELLEVKVLLGEDAADTFTELVRHVDRLNDGRITFDVFLSALTSEHLRHMANESQGRLRGFMTLSSRSSQSSSDMQRSSSNHSNHSNHSIRSVEAIEIHEI